MIGIVSLSFNLIFQNEKKQLTALLAAHLTLENRKKFENWLVAKVRSVGTECIEKEKEYVILLSFSYYFGLIC
jgi:hypothetical protein